MPCPHYKVTIVKRSDNKSAVAGAAYQSGENLFSEYDQKWKYWKSKKQEEIYHKEIMLPTNAPPEYADRNKLWNAVEGVENQWNSQLARRIIMALPNEVPKEQYPLNGEERLRILYETFNPDSTVDFQFDYSSMIKTGLNTKDYQGARKAVEKTWNADYTGSGVEPGDGQSWRKIYLVLYR